MTWELVIFDCDGVLVDSEPIANRILADMLAENIRESTADAGADDGIRQESRA